MVDVSIKEKIISPRTNSPYGSRHWFNTILARMKSVGEYMVKHELTDKQRADWGKSLMDDGNELAEHFDKISEQTRQSIIDAIQTNTL